jgi:hypothetical protein
MFNMDDFTKLIAGLADGSSDYKDVQEFMDKEIEKISNIRGYANDR